MDKPAVDNNGTLGQLSVNFDFPYTLENVFASFGNSVIWPGSVPIVLEFVLGVAGILMG